MPSPQASTQRVVVALALLLVGVFGVAVFALAGRSGKDHGTPSAQPTPTSTVFTEPPSPTAPPVETPTPTVEPTVVPTSPPATSNGGGHGGHHGGGGGGGGGTPNMPNTGLHPALALLAVATTTSAAVLARQRHRHVDDAGA